MKKIKQQFTSETIQLAHKRQGLEACRKHTLANVQKTFSGDIELDTRCGMKKINRLKRAMGRDRIRVVEAGVVNVLITS